MTPFRLILLLLAMTIAELFTQTAQNLNTAPAAMSAKEQSRLVRAANAGLGDFVEALPGIRRRETATPTLGLPVTKNITATQGSTEIVFSPTWAGQTDFLGRTVALDADPGRYNRLQAENTLLANFQGTTGAAVMTLYSDAVLLGGQGNLVDGDVILSWGTGNKQLIHGKPEGWQRENREYAYQTGEPQRWWVDGLDGMSGGSNPLYVLRVWPQPVSMYDLIYQRRLWPEALTVDLLDSTDELPCLPREEWVLVSLCQYGIVNSPLWQGTANKDDAENDYKRAAAWLEDKKGQRGTTQRGKLKTKNGY